MSSNQPDMAELLASAEITPLQKNDTVEGIIISHDKHEVWLDLGMQGTGLVVGRELEQVAKELKEGDSMSASVLETESPEGYAILSLRKFSREKGWEVLEERAKTKESFGIVPFDANKGGLLIEVEGVRGFLPVSQLSSENYPRVTGADKDEILQRLNQLIGRTLMVRILDLDRSQNKLIVSEKEAQREFTEGKISNLKVGEKVKGIATGVVDFGVFLNVEGVEGLIHISEIAWDRVDNPSKYVKVGQEIEAIIIAIDQDKLSLSIKQLSADPWTEEIAHYNEGDEVDGTVTRITPFGAFVQVSPIIEALVHISELSDKHVSDPNTLVSVGEKKKFRIIGIDKNQHKLSLSLKPKTNKPVKEAIVVSAPKETVKDDKKSSKKAKE
ncbi:S1 RNA-binding domain-containing protein [Candidatus Saccharibacteria bacterium]|nr:S1 RNA-binding domain-containing protein [Candidatus Saccharibacteria bacterium]